MGKNKLERFAENATFACLHQPPFEEVVQGNYRLKGHWNTDYFGNGNPITLELGCGKGEYTCALAEAYASRNFIGMDIKGARLWYGAKHAEVQRLRNVAFARGRIETIRSFFGHGEIAEIWITFPDPQLKTRREKKRLTSPGFLRLYQYLLVSGGVVHLKTDSRELHLYTLGVLQGLKAEILESYTDIDFLLKNRQDLAIPTRYEQMFRAEGKVISYVRFKLSGVDFTGYPTVEIPAMLGINAAEGR